jgi:hypothetical protein
MAPVVTLVRSAMDCPVTLVTPSSQALSEPLGVGGVPETRA